MPGGNLRVLVGGETRVASGDLVEMWVQKPTHWVDPWQCGGFALLWDG